MKKFTFIELLVVVAVVAILAGMILPALAAERNAKTVACSDNLRRLGGQVGAYAADFDGFIPTDGIAIPSSKPKGWFWILSAAYPDMFPKTRDFSAKQGRQFWHCPEAPLSDSREAGPNGPSDYGRNSQWGLRQFATAADPSYKLDSCAKEPAKKFVFADIAFQDRPVLYPVYQQRLKDAARHEEKSAINLVFFDNHVETRSDLENLTRWDENQWPKYNSSPLTERAPWN